MKTICGSGALNVTGFQSNPGSSFFSLYDPDDPIHSNTQQFQGGEISRSETLSKQAAEGTTLLREWQQGNLKAQEVFDIQFELKRELGMLVGKSTSLNERLVRFDGTVRCFGIFLSFTPQFRALAANLKPSVAVT